MADGEADYSGPNQNIVLDQRLSKIERDITRLRGDFQVLDGRVQATEEDIDSLRDVVASHDVQLRIINVILQTMSGDDVIEVIRPTDLKMEIVNKYKRIFDLYDVSTTRVKVRGFDMLGDSSNKVVAIAGVWKDVGAGVNAAMETSIVPTDNTYIYLKLERATSTVTIEAETTMPNGDEDTEYYPLWYLPWNAEKTEIRLKGIRDLRNTRHWDAGA